VEWERTRNKCIQHQKRIGDGGKVKLRDMSIQLKKVKEKAMAMPSEVQTFEENEK